MKVMFWNVGRKDCAEAVSKVAAEYKADVVLLAESSKNDPAKQALALSGETKRLFFRHVWYDPSPRVEILSCFPKRNWKALSDREGIVARSVKEPGCLPVTIVAVHSASQLYWSQPSDRFALGARIRKTVEAIEARAKHNRTIVVGDFNSDPFDDALTNSDALHAVMCRRVASKGSRVVGEQEHRFFYNPMWSLMGDVSDGPPGSYYYRGSTPSSRFWHMFDQVLIRPDLINAFDPTSLKIVTEVPEYRLATTAGTPNKNAISDHFPIVFALDLIKEFPDG